MAYVFEPQQPVSIPVDGTDKQFPVHQIYCVGRNYAAHAREMGHDPDREPPFFFCKPADAALYVAPGAHGKFPYPPLTKDCHYEIELVVALSQGGKDIPVEKALDHVYGYALGLDMTRRDLQGEQKKLGRSWEIGKAFAHSAPIGPIHTRAKLGDLDSGAIWLDVNGKRHQTGDLSDMIWPIADTIAYLSGLFELKAGDLIYTGTPDGVGPIVRGDVMKGGIDGLGEFTVDVI